MMRKLVYLLTVQLLISNTVQQSQQLMNLFGNPYRRNSVNREQTKLKLDLLGSLLKKHVSELRTDGNEADLVFLVDSSASVGADNFYNEIKFIRKLLADFTVSYNSTRVVIITYSSVNQVIRQVDHMSIPVHSKHKCSLFEAEIPAITYNSGGTYTLGALLEAQDVFRFSRRSAKKAVFLITDGYSNGGDPRPAAERLKQRGVEFYTFGIRNGNVKELYDMASEPRKEHSFILDSFEEFEALARRALHKDLSGSVYLPQDPVRCSNLCQGFDCCDARAECSCGAHSGYYACICPRGYYGRGLKGDCHKCPAGTYKPRLDPGDRRSCIPCPDENQISPTGSYSALQCHCKQGYSLRNGKCTMMDCPRLQPPDNGHFIRNECNNVFNAACGVKCNSGYKLSGSSIRLCLPTGVWSGEPAHCTVKTCRKLKPPSNGYVTCNSSRDEVDTVCEFGCNHGFRLIGSRTRTCLPISLWGGLPAYCKPISCSRLRKPNYGMIVPEDCSQTKKRFGDQCAFACKSGFQLQGPTLRECGAKGLWSGGPYLSRCVDVTPPSLTCPENITVYANKHSYYTRVQWKIPETKDNSGFQPLVSSLPAVRPPTTFKIGRNVIKYISEDLSGNKNTCTFQVNVLDVEPPVVDMCDSPPEFISETEDVEISWEEPIFHDNSRTELVIERTHDFGKFSFGTTEVRYTARDASGNSVTCTINIKLQRHLCDEPDDPINGHTRCREDAYAVQCTLACNEGFAFAFKPTGDYFCQVSGPGTWYPETNVLPFPDCSVTSLSSVLSVPTDLRVNIVSHSSKRKHICDDKFFLKQVENHVRMRVLEQLDLMCGDSLYCDIKDLEAICSDIIANHHIYSNKLYRRKRSTADRRLRTAVNSTSRVINLDPSSSFNQDSFALSMTSNDGSERQVIEIVFKLVGKYRELIETRRKQEALVAGVGEVQVEIEDAASSGTLDILIGQEKIEAEGVKFSPPSFVCGIGSVVSGQSCVNCPVGTFYNVLHKNCTPCPAGTFQDKEAQVSCLVCPGGTYTRLPSGASRPEHCKAQCLPGFISEDGLERCRTCQIGTYQSDYAQTSCLPCPAGQTTLQRGATLPNQCKSLCPAGKSSETGLEPCYPCPRGYFQPSAGQTFCFRCPHNADTPFISTQSIGDCSGVHSSSRHDVSSLEKLEVNDCFSLPCQNSGHCVALQQGFRCECEEGFTGSYCEIELNPCESSPCLNMGICSPAGISFTCICQPGYTGSHCQMDIDECENNKCMNNATCVENSQGGGLKRYVCECEDGFQGEFCEENRNDCENHGCENGGECIDGVGTFSCRCPPGFSGRLCEEETDDCANQPCGLGATCIDAVNSFSCQCPPGKRGWRCEELENLCSSNPCHGGSTCLPTLGHFQCICPPSYKGKLCQTQVLPNFILTFGNSPSTETLDYVLLEQVHSPIDQFTLCFWMKSDDKDNYGTPVSYATTEQDNELTITDYSGFVLSVKGEKVVTDVTANDGKWHFVSFTWDSYTGSWLVYKDGVLRDRGEDLAKGKYIDEGGILVIGQEQDERGDDFSPSESFRGSITRLDMWSKVLTAEDIRDLRLECAAYYGDIVSWSDMYRGLRGEIRISDLDVCMSCPRLDSIPHGSLNIEGKGPLTRGILSCDEGYSLEGTNTISCNIFGEWESEPADCRLINCGYPGYIKDGVVSGTSYLYGDSVWFSCESGYKLEGWDRIICLANGSWSHTKPTCTEIRCKLPKRLKNGNYTVLSRQYTKTSSSQIGDRIRFSCNPGFFMDGLESLVCLEDGTWSDLPPICQPVPCSKPPVVPNGYVAGGIPDGVQQGTVLTYNCDPGYEIASLDTAVCGASGRWEKPVPKCLPVLCKPPDTVANGRTTFGGTTFGEMVIYKCKKGHYLLGPMNSTCTEIGMWEPPPPTCVPVDCGEIQPVAHGSVEYERTTFQNVARFSCLPGYTLRGPRERQCSSSGHWSNKSPTCALIRCDPPSGVPLGSLVRNETYLAGERAEFACLPGHVLYQEEPLVCKTSGRWAGSTPYCIPLLCAGPASLPNGTLIIGSWTREPLSDPAIRILKEAISERQKSGSLYQLDSEDGPMHLQSGNRNTVYYPVGSELWLDCNQGYTLVGNFTNSCDQEDAWQNVFPVCREIACPPIQSIPNGEVMVEGFRFKQNAFFSCLKGYHIIGDEIRTCMEDGVWSGEEPMCLPRMCQDPAPIANGYVTDLISLEFGSVITYTCDDGFKLIGGSERVCGHNGQWSGQEPVCVDTSQTCLVPQLLNSGYVAFDGNLEVGSLAWYDCNEDYELLGQFERTCIENGTWSGSEPVCNPKFCTPVDSLLHGTVLGRLYEHGSLLQFSCNTGYTLHGAPSIRCTESGAWSQPLPVCVPVICPEPDQVPHGRIRGSARRYDDSIVYECDSGFTLLGSRVRKCNLDSQWSGPTPYCASILCPELPLITNGVSVVEMRVPGERARFRCNLGWQLQGASNITCNSRGEWEGDIPACVPSVCRVDLRRTNATLLESRMDEYEVGTKLHWTCTSGYKMVGSNQIICLPNGEWDLDLPQCHIKQCKDVFRLENGVIFGTRNTSSHLEVRFSCDNGYHKVMESFLACEIDGRWKGNAPICSRQVCSNNFNSDNMIASFKPMDSTYMAEFRCAEQYELVGSSKMVCTRNNTWSSGQPNCKLAYCRNIEKKAKMIHKQGQIPLGESIRFQCEPGYQLDGPEFVQCLESGEWEAEFPVCLPMSCRISTNLRHGEWRIQPSQYRKELWAMGRMTRDGRRRRGSGDLYVGDILSVSCDHRFDVYGETNLTCLNDLTLSAEMPKCKEKHCGRLPGISNGFVVHNGTYRGAAATYHCDRGYQIIGSSVRKCRRNRSWSRSAPTCEPISCEKPHDIAHGEVDYNPNNMFYKSKVKFYCHLGYELTGPDERECGEDGTWSGEEPECVLVRCQPPKIPLHGEQDIHELTVGGAVSYTCNHGFRLEGDKILTCLSNKTWSGRVPTCHKISCQLPRNITNGLVSVSETEYQANIEYSCEAGFSLVGYRARSCLHSGDWSGEEPNCVPSLCPSPELTNGWIKIDGHGPGDQATLGCNTGFQLSGSSLIVCQMSLWWSPAPGTCAPVHCPQPPHVNNAVLHVTGFDYLDSVTYTCIPGFEIRGAADLICSENAQWKNNVPSCLPKPCGHPGIFPNMKVRFESESGYDLGFGSRAIYTCNPGSVSKSRNVLNCRETGEWDGEPISPCLQVPCGEPLVPANGSVSLRSKDNTFLAVLICNPGFILFGEKEITCLNNNMWEFSMVECFPVDCGDPPSIQNGELRGNKTTFQETVQLKCDSGYHPAGSTELTCTESGEWSTLHISCRLAQCPSLPGIPHGNVSYSTSNIETEFPWGTVARFTCGSGYMLYGQHTLTCLQNQSWDGDSPTCQRIWCGALDPPKHGFMMGVGKQWGDTVRFACAEGYRIFGAAEVHCLETGQWNSPPPTCHRVWCDVPVSGVGQLLPPPLHKTFPHRSRIQLVCRPGHKQRGDLSISCQPNGRWSRPDGACHKISCGRPQLESGAVLLSQTFLFGSKVPYSCPSGEFPVNSPLICQADGSWSAQPGRCFRVNRK